VDAQWVLLSCRCIILPLLLLLLGQVLLLRPLLWAA
jgi:hypothetical protein